MAYFYSISQQVLDLGEADAEAQTQKQGGK